MIPRPRVSVVEALVAKTVKAAAILVASPRYVEWLRAQVGELLEFSVLSADELGRMPVALSNAALVLVELDDATRSETAALIERLGDRYPALPVIALGDAGQPESMLAAMRAGARDFLAPGRDDAGATAQIEHWLRRGSGRGVAARGRIVSVLAGHSSDGTAFLAEHLALAMRESLPRNEAVLLLDLALPAGASAVFLNTHHDYSVLNAIQDAYRCDQTLVDTAFGRHSSGVFMLGLPETQVGVAPIDVEELASLLEVVRGLFAMTIVAADSASGLNLLKVIAEASNQSLLLGDQSILSSRYNQMLLRELRQVGGKFENMALVVDRYTRRLGLEPEKLAELLQLPLLATLGGDELNRLQAMNAGEALYSFAPRDDYGQAARELAQRLMHGGHVPADIAPRRGLFDRLLGA